MGGTINHIKKNTPVQKTRAYGQEGYGKAVTSKTYFQIDHKRELSDQGKHISEF